MGMSLFFQVSAHNVHNDFFSLIVALDEKSEDYLGIISVEQLLHSKTQPRGVPSGKVGGSPKSLGLIDLGLWMSVQNLIAIHRRDVEIFQSEPNNTSATPPAWLKTPSAGDDHVMWSNEPEQLINGPWGEIVLSTAVSKNEQREKVRK